MARFYANENFPLPVVEALRELGHEVITVRETGKADRATPDNEVFDYARSNGLTLLTLNRRHFIRLHEQKPDYAGIVVCTFDRDFVAQAQRIHERVKSEASISGQLLRINRPGLSAGG